MTVSWSAKNIQKKAEKLNEIFANLWGSLWKKINREKQGIFLQRKKKELPAIKQKDMDDVKMNSVITKKKKEKKIREENNRNKELHQWIHILTYHKLF